MLLASLFLAALARSLASPVTPTSPSGPIPHPIYAITETLTARQCDPTRMRTIYDILWSCIGVILLCTYISIHHNIPDQNDSWIKATWIKLRTTLYALLAPEMVIMWAIRQRIMSGRIAEQNKHRGWTRTHGFFLQMGGLVQLAADSTYRVVCDVDGVEIPRIPEKEIRDRGKGDILAKAIVILQTTWFVAQCIARHVQGLVLTEIELVTLAFATLNVITYGLWWDKPLNVQYPIYFDMEGKRIDGPEENESNRAWYKVAWGREKGYSRLGDEDTLHEWGIKHIFWEKGLKALFRAVFTPLMDMTGEQGERNKKTSVHPFYAAVMSTSDQDLGICCGSMIGVLFGGVHLIGWDFRFPTLTELWLWRASSLVLVTIPVFFVVASIGSYAEEKSTSNLPYIIRRVFSMPALTVAPPLYLAARVIILFQAFFALRDLPESAYENVKWTEFIPHI